MSSKFKRQQQKRRWAEGGTLFTPSYLNEVEALRTDSSTHPAVRHVCDELQRLVSLQSTFGEVADLKGVLASLAQGVDKQGPLSQPCPPSRQALALVLELLFLPNSKPLHRQLLAAVRKLPQQLQGLVGELIAARIRQEVAGPSEAVAAVAGAGGATAAPAADGVSTSGPGSSSGSGRGLVLGQMLSSVMWLPGGSEWVRPVCVECVELLSQGLAGVLGSNSPAACSTPATAATAAPGTAADAADDVSRHISPSQMEEVQDSIGALYYIACQAGPQLAGSPRGCRALEGAADVMLHALQGRLLVREAMASAAVAVWAIAVLPAVPPHHVAAQFAEGLFLDPGSGRIRALDPSGSSTPCPPGADPVAGGLLEQALRARGSSLVREIQRFSPVGKICSLKGHATVIPVQAMCAAMVLERQGQAPAPFSFLVDGALAYGCSAVAAAPDAHFKFHATCVVNICVEQIRATWQQAASMGVVKATAATACAPATAPATADGSGSGEMMSDLAACSLGGEGEPEGAGAQADGSGNAAAVAAGTGATAAGPTWHPATLQGADRDRLMRLLWANMDEPLAQTVRQVHEAFATMLDVLDYQQRYSQPAPSVAAAATASPQQPPPQSAAEFYRATALQLLRLPYTRKGRYLPLVALLPRLGAMQMLGVEPQLVRHTLLAMQDDMVANSASALLKALLQALREECSRCPRRAPAAATAAATAGGDAAGPGPGSSSSSSAMEVDGEGGEVDAAEAWQSWWRPALLQALYSSSEKLRMYVSVHALPVLLELEPRLTLGLCRAVLGDAAPEPVPGTSHVAALVSILKAARLQQLLGDLDSLCVLQPGSSSGSSSGSSGGMAMDPEAVLMSAVAHSSEAVRLECLELVCVNPKYTEAPGRLELAVVRRWLSLCTRHPAGGQRNKCVVLLTKLLLRIRTAVHAIQHRNATSKSAGATGGRHAGAARAPPASSALQGEGEPLAAAAPAKGDACVVGMQQEFMQWLTRALLGSLYPGGPYERKSLAMDLLNAVFEIFGPCGSGSNAPGSGSGSGSAGRAPHSKKRPALETGTMTASKAVPPELRFEPYCPGFMSASTTTLLLAGVVDSWDKLRQAASAALSRLPSPLPGLEEPGALAGLLAWALGLLDSPRARESDAGARLIRLLFSKYVMALHWRVQLHPLHNTAEVALPPQPSAEEAGTQGQGQGQGGLLPAVLTFLTSLLDRLEARVQAGRSDLLPASRSGLAHGGLLLARYLAEELPWQALLAAGGAATAAGGGGGGEAAGGETLQAWVARLLRVMEQVSELLIAPLSGKYNVGAEDVAQGYGYRPTPATAATADTATATAPAAAADGGDGAGDESEADSDDDDDEEEEGDEGVGGDGDELGALGPQAQVVITACWTSAKEVALLAGMLARQLPLPEDAPSEPTPPSDASSSPQQLLSLPQLSDLGGLLLRLLFAVKHNGAVEKLGIGLCSLAERLLRSSHPGVTALPAAWLRRCLERLQQAGQSRDDIVRRSAGLPFAIVALFLAEPTNAPKALLPRGMDALLQVATSPACRLASSSSSGADAASGPEPWPVVHAFNALRHAFNDSNLAVDTSGYFARGIQACLDALRSPAWEVRNSASLAFTALLVRVLGFKNTGGPPPGGASPAGASAGAGASGGAGGGWESCKKAVSAAEFFQRFPPLHAYLLGQLGEAVEQLEGAGPGAPVIHPSLHPVLIVLSRLRPGPPLQPIMSAALSPAAFVPLVSRCACARPMAVRSLAALALSPLATPEALADVATSLLDQLPQAPEPQQGQQAAPRQLSANAVHGALLQLATLLASNVPAAGSGAAEALLQLVVPRLAAAGAACGPPASGRSAGCSAIPAAYIRALAAALRLVPSSACGQKVHLRLASLADVHCWRAIEAVNAEAVAAATAGATATITSLGLSDFPSAMRSVMLKEAVGLWLGPALHCYSLSAATANDAAADDEAKAAAVAERFASGLRARVEACLSSPSYEVRAAGLQALVRYLAALSARLAPRAALRVSERKARAEVTAADGMGGHDAKAQLLMDAMAGSAAGRAAVAALCGGLAPLVWQAAGQEKVLKVKKRLLRALGLLAALSQDPASGSAAAVPAPAAGPSGSSSISGGSSSATGYCWASGAARLALVQQLLAGAKGVEPRSEALRCFGRAVAPLVGATSLLIQGMGSGSSASDPAPEAAAVAAGLDLAGFSARTLQGFVDSVAEHSRPHLPEEIRLAAVDALSASGLLLLTHRQDQACSSGSSAPPQVDKDGEARGRLRGAAELAALQGWTTSLALMEDEDEEVRGRAAALGQAALDAHQRSAATAATADPPATASAAATGCLYVEEVERRLVAGAARRFGDGCGSGSSSVRDALAAWLAGLVMDGAEPLPHLLRKPKPGRGPSRMARRLFDREADNNREEAMLLAQMAASSLRAMLQPQQQAQLQPPQLLLPWVLEAAGRLGDAAEGLQAAAAASASGGPGWLGGTLAHPAVFPYVYRALLPLWAVGPEALAGAQQQQAEEAVATVRQHVSSFLAAAAVAGYPSLLGGVVAAVAELWGVPLPLQTAPQAGEVAVAVGPEGVVVQQAPALGQPGQPAVPVLFLLEQ